MGTGLQRFASFLIVMFLWAVLPGCGGGGDSPGPQSSSPPPGGGSATSQMEIKDLGTFNLAAGATAGPISLEVPAGAASVMFIADGGNTTADIDIEDVINPNGNLMVGRRKTFQDPAGKNQLHAADDTLASGILWNTQGASIPAGTYKFQVASYQAPATVQVHAIINHRENPTGGTLDVNLIFCGVPGLNKDNAQADPSFQVMFNKFKQIYAQANIQVKVAGTFNCNQAAELEVINSEEEFGDLLAQSSMTGNQAMNFFFVQDFEPPFTLPLKPGEHHLGQAAKIEGPALLQGTRYSGVVVTTLGEGLSVLEPAELLQQGVVMAHEGGHYFGLYHPTERCGAGATKCPGFDINENGQIDSWEVVDPIQDTPECPASLFTLFDSEVTADECFNFDGQNVMFWSVAPNHVQLTATQKAALHDNPYIH